MYEPEITPGPSAGEADWDRWVRRFFRANSRTFSLATRLLPTEVRQPVAVLYWYCRTIDNIADQVSIDVGRDGALERLAQAESALERCLAGRPDPDPLWHRLAMVHSVWTLPSRPMFELIDGARWDLEGRPIHSTDDLVAYSERVAGSIGEMMLPFLQQDVSHREDLVAPARALGVAMQFTNVLRDVGEDLAVLSRTYLPAELLHGVGIAPGERPDPASSAYRDLLERLMYEAERRFDIGMSGVHRLAPGVRFGIRSAARLYREILNEIRANAYDNVGTRAVVSPVRKLRCILSDGYERRKRMLLLPS